MNICRGRLGRPSVNTMGLNELNKGLVVIGSIDSKFLLSSKILRQFSTLEIEDDGHCNKEINGWWKGTFA